MFVNIGHNFVFSDKAVNIHQCFKQTSICADMILHSCVVSSHQPLDELSEGLIWASGEGCLEDVVFLLSTGVEVNTRGQVRLRE